MAEGLPYTNSWGNYYYYDYGCMKISPNGQKLGVALYNNGAYNTTNYHNFEIYDFNNTTGAVSNSLALSTGTTTLNYYYYGGWGCEFSPDGTKFYGSRINNYVNNPAGIYQWNLCAGSNSAIIASVYTVGTGYNYGAMQVASNGKIYCSQWGQTSLGVINSPNSLGSACSFSSASQSLGNKTSYYSLPNFM